MESTYLGIQSIDLGAIEAGRPEGALPVHDRVSLLATVEATERMGAGFPRRSGWHRGIRTRVPLAAASDLPLRPRALSTLAIRP